MKYIKYCLILLVCEFNILGVSVRNVNDYNAIQCIKTLNYDVGWYGDPTKQDEIQQGIQGCLDGSGAGQYTNFSSYYNGQCSNNCTTAGELLHWIQGSQFCGQTCCDKTNDGKNVTRKEYSIQGGYRVFTTYGTWVPIGTCAEESSCSGSAPEGCG